MSNSTVKVTHLYNDPKGISYFGDTQIDTALLEFAPPAPAVNVSAPRPAKQYLFLELPPNWYGEPHPAPSRQLMILIRGELEVTVSNNSKKIFKPGDIALAEDISGEGHATRNLSSDPSLLLIVQY